MSFNESVVYQPEDLRLLGEVLDEVVQSLPPNLRTPANRVAIARNILACALTGERDRVLPDGADRRGAALVSADAHDRRDPHADHGPVVSRPDGAAHRDGTRP